MPDTPDMKKQTGVPLGLVMSPLATPLEGEYPIPIGQTEDMAYTHYSV